MMQNVIYLPIQISCTAVTHTIVRNKVECIINRLIYIEKSKKKHSSRTHVITHSFSRTLHVLNYSIIK